MRFSRAAAALCALGCLTVSLPTAAALNGVSPWAEAEVQTAQALGLMPDRFAALDATQPITRAEFCAAILAVYESASGTTVQRTDTVYFTDCDDPDVNTARALGLVSGRGDLFAPDEYLTRQDLCVMLDSVARALGAEAPEVTVSCSDFPDGGSTRSYATDAVELMLSAGVMRGVTVSDGGDPELIGTASYTILDPQGTATREQALILCTRFVDAFEAAEAEEAETPLAPDDLLNVTPSLDRFLSDPLDAGSLTEDEKLTYVFGESAARYTDQAEAESHMVNIEIPVWTLTSDGEKLASTRWIEVHEQLAPVFEAVFQEIFESDEKFPIKNVGGYSWRSNSRSEHRQGTAIDINWEENMECTIDENGEVVAITSGTHWTPYDDPYSIPADSELVAIFKKYGFSWGGDAWTSKRDYMHFSYFGT